MGPKLFRIILPVSDITQAERFYSKVLGIPGKRVSPGRHYFDCGGIILACFDAKADGDSEIPRANAEHIYFAVGDLDAAHGRARSAGCSWIEDEIQKRLWGERSFYARDPFGNPICFVDQSTVFSG
jgi:catechol 2,3-dioxygenase-like lactoylglutathione lyase family enzyme